MFNRSYYKQKLTPIPQLNRVIDSNLFVARTHWRRRAKAVNRRQSIRRFLISQAQAAGKSVKTDVNRHDRIRYTITRNDSYHQSPPWQFLGSLLLVFLLCALPQLTSQVTILPSQQQKLKMILLKGLKERIQHLTFYIDKNNKPVLEINAQNCILYFSYRFCCSTFPA